MPEYIVWHESVFLRDNWTCQKCEKRGGRLEGHHLFPVGKLLRKLSVNTLQEAREHKLEIFDTMNGVTLCYDCHNITKRN